MSLRTCKPAPMHQHNTGKMNFRPHRITTLTVAVILILGSTLSGWTTSAQPPASKTTWTSAQSPVTLKDDFVVPAGSNLTIEVGVKVLLGEGVSLIIQGDIIAIGTAENPIIFTSANSQPAPGQWGNLRFVTADTTLSYDEQGNYIKGSRLEYCIVEYGGKPSRKTSREFLGGAIHCRKSSPYVKNLTVRYNRSAEGGGLFCHEFASPYISGCLFLENEADGSGGGVSCFFYSNAVIQNSTFQANRAGNHGGGIYFSFSSPQIISNVIENNTAKSQGGGMYCSNTVTQAISRVRSNVFLSNQAGYKANSIFLTAKIETIFQENCFFSGDGYDVYVEALEKDLDLRGNYFGPISASDLETRIYDRYDDPGQKSVLLDPVLDAPPLNLLNAPQQISGLDLYGDAAFSTDWPLPLCPEAPIYLQAGAEDRNPYHADFIPIKLRSSVSNPQGVTTLLWETGASTGVFRVAGQVATVSMAKGANIKAQPGETLFFSVEGHDISRPVETPKSYITNLTLPDEADSMHVISNQPRITWKFRDIFGKQQAAYQMQIAGGTPFTAPPVWDSGERNDSQTSAEPDGLGLVDGTTYSLRLKINNGAQWSDWADLTFRLNSMPTIPEIVSPKEGLIVAKAKPELILKASTDAENDPIYYELQLCQDEAGNRVLAIEKEGNTATAQLRWIAQVDLQDDAEYFWRVRARDAFETGSWTKMEHFWVNLVEESPLPFALQRPESGSQIYQLKPVFSWDATTDPDPLSKVRYRLLFSKDAQFSKINTLSTETDLTFQEAPQPLANETIYYWKVEAIDNTGRITTSNKTGNIFINTTPSVPVVLAPSAGAELGPDSSFAWKKSVDPNPDDVVSYHLQIAEREFNTPLIDEVVSPDNVAVKDLQNTNRLVDNREYRFRVRAEDNQGITSKWAEVTSAFFFNKVNDPPSAVTGTITPDGIMVNAPAPIISWGTASDPDRSDPPSSISYLIQFAQDSAFSVGARQVQVVAGATRVAVPGLDDNMRWFYHIRAKDRKGAVSVWSATRNFILNTKNEPPLPFSLLEPAQSLVTYKLTGIKFTWEEAKDPDFGDKIQYRFHLVKAGSESQGEPRKIAGTSWTLDYQLANDTDYEWWVEAEDLAGLRTPSNEKFRFHVNTTPSVPVARQIPEGILTNEGVFHWEASGDPDPADKLTYELRIVSTDNPNAALELKGITADKVSAGIFVKNWKNLTTLKDNQTYNFQVRALDPHGVYSSWSQSVGFSLDLVNEAPLAPNIQIPQNDAVIRSTLVMVEWSPGKDPDPSDRQESLKYRLQYVSGTDFKSAEMKELFIAAGFPTQTQPQVSDNRLWSVRVRAEDSRGGLSAWSAPVKFVVNNVEEPPQAPKISTPQSGANFLSNQPIELRWLAVTDPDYGAKVSYQVWWWPKSDNKSGATGQDVGSNLSYTLKDLPGNQDYQWQVIAKDETGLTCEGEIGSFHVDIPNRPPLPFRLLLPENGKFDVPPQPELSWEAAIDEDAGDQITYTVYLTRDVTFKQGVKTYSDLKTTKLVIDEALVAGAIYYWKVKAQDSKGLAIWGSKSSVTPFRFIVKQP
ncbi:MAG: hypothetical protein NTW14_02880 [bacterium]|nr:hypothetical protein [bacterium]